MNTKLIAAALIAASAAVATSAFASGYGPSGPVGYNWGNTNQGQSVQRVWAERRSSDRNVNTGYGGSESGASQSGERSQVGQPVGEGH